MNKGRWIMECPYFDAQTQCSCRQHPDRLNAKNVEEYCRRSRYVLCPVFNLAESVDLAGIFDDDEAL